MIKKQKTKQLKEHAQDLVRAILLTCFGYLLVSIGVVVLVIFFGLLETGIGSLFNCSLEDGAVLVGLVCHQPGQIQTFLQTSITVFNVFLFFVGALFLAILMNPLTPIVAVIFLFLYEKAQKIKKKQKST